MTTSCSKACSPWWLRDGAGRRDRFLEHVSFLGHSPLVLPLETVSFLGHSPLVLPLETVNAGNMVLGPRSQGVGDITLPAHSQSGSAGTPARCDYGQHGPRSQVSGRGRHHAAGPFAVWQCWHTGAL